MTGTKRGLRTPVRPASAGDLARKRGPWFAALLVALAAYDHLRFVPEVAYRFATPFT